MTALLGAVVPGATLLLRHRVGGRERRSRSTIPRAARSRPLPSASVSVVVPAINEERCLPWVLERIPDWVSEVVLVDGLSSDHTELVARRINPNVVLVHQPRPGKGAALRAGFAAATGDIVVMIDADGSNDPAEIAMLVDALEDGAGLAKGSRQMPGGGSADLTRIRSVGNSALVRVTNLLYGCRFTDLCYGYCAFWRHHLAALALTADGFEIETQLILSAVRAGLEIREVPSIELPRRAGASNLHAVRDGIRVLRAILNEHPRRAETRARWARRLTLVPVRLPAPGTRGWVPAGRERRRHTDRRTHDRAVPTGRERRRFLRRRNPVATVTVYRAAEASGQPDPGLMPADPDPITPDRISELPSLGASELPSLGADLLDA